MQSVKRIVDKAGDLDALLEKARQDEAKRLLPGTLFDAGPIVATSTPDEQENWDRKPRRRKSEAA
jgi:hypothetical protein